MGTTLPTTTTLRSTTISTRTTPTTICRCIHDGHYYLPGERVYNRTDSMGCISFVFCNSTCQLVESPGPCMTTPLTSTSTTDGPPCQNICINGTLNQMGCPPVVEPDCPQTEKVYDQYGCCYTYKCIECLDFDGNLRQPGDVWESNCLNCTCIPLNMGTVLCKRVDCPYMTPPSCRPDSEVVMMVDPSNTCCSIPICQCKPQGCRIAEITCPQGFEVTCNKMDERQCCPDYNCTRKAVCVVDDTEYQPGVVIYAASEPCSKCHCSWDPDPETNMYSVVCEPMKCFTDCPLGYQYKILPLKCCGMCVQVYCILPTEFNTTHIIKPGDSWFPAGSNCSFYSCSLIKGKPVLNLVKKTCPVVTVRHCDTDAKSCCSNCVKNLCHLKTRSLRFANLTSESVMDIPYCHSESNVGTSTTTSSTTECKCCEVLKNTTMEVKLTCLTNETIPFTYYPAEKCGCDACS